MIVSLIGMQMIFLLLLQAWFAYHGEHERTGAPGEEIAVVSLLPGHSVVALC